MSSAEPEAPDYDVRIDADEFLSGVVEQAVEYADEYEEKRAWWNESLDAADEWYDARHWMLDALGGRKASADAVAALQPEQHSLRVDSYRNDDGTVDVRGYMRWLSSEADKAHDRAGPPGHNPQADEAESAYVSVLSLLRDDYGIGWPRLDDLGGTPLECDLP